jgi:serine/threonine protein phosphatase 1
LAGLALDRLVWPLLTKLIGSIVRNPWIEIRAGQVSRNWLNSRKTRCSKSELSLIRYRQENYRINHVPAEKPDDLVRAYAIGDVHGQFEKLLHAHRLVARDREEVNDDTAPVVHLGDYVDRGRNSRKVIEHLMQGQSNGEPWIALKGNHDRMMTCYLENPSRRDPRLRPELDWFHPRIGGLTALESYGVDITLPPDELHRQARAAVPKEHRTYLENLLAYYRIGELYFCHAGVRPGVPLQDQTEDDLIWIRDEFHRSDADHGALIIHGHTPVFAVSHYGNRVDIDTGSAFGHDLSTVVIEGPDLFLLTDNGRRPIVPDRNQPYNWPDASTANTRSADGKIATSAG